ncbi:MAG: DUF1990 family protein [Planctomycetaceae bacterium]
MLLIRKPTAEFIAATMRSQRTARFTYDAVGWTRERKVPTGFATTRWQAVIGRGEDDLRRAKQVAAELRMLRLGWIEPAGPLEPIAPESLVCTLARQSGMYSLNVGRVIYVDDAADSFAFGYGTLPEYPIRGEERFAVALDRGTNDVTFEIFSFSTPRSPLMLLARPLLREIQRRFCTQSSAAMSGAVRAAGHPAAVPA